MARWIGALESQPIENNGMDLLGLGVDARRFDLIGGWLTKLSTQRIFGGHASEDVAGTDEENRLGHR